MHRNNNQRIAQHRCRDNQCKYETLHNEYRQTQPFVAIVLLNDIGNIKGVQIVVVGGSAAGVAIYATIITVHKCIIEH